MTSFAWSGPFEIASLLARCLADDQPWPPARGAIYLVSRERWNGAPDAACEPLYFGGNTGVSNRFCTRVGDLIADMHGFFDGGTGHHSGGQSVYEWCRKNQVLPGALFISWATRDPWCDRCAEIEVATMFPGAWSKPTTLLNKSRPPPCTVHSRPA